ncbi:hypothetical protein FFLO_04466 [Filobasidium floriforme]|uniref:ribose-phosphate diphosphokinase n=1 Tax=Filobasidium floriforme TaxID=5210 RepID=A0A8K0JIX2_9TREE|nr:hypothetical protein FFLO_04466 [Filobasidium floriforme]
MTLLRHPRRIALLTGNSHHRLADDVANRLGIALTPCNVGKFSALETSVQINSSVRDEDVFILQSPSPPDINDHLMELLILVSACKTASAKRITAVIPCYPYARQDKKDKSRAPITAKLVANLLAVAGCDHVITMDLHASQIQGFFDIPCDNLLSEMAMVGYIKTEIDGWRDGIIVSPDAGGAKRATALADRLNLDFALINRKRKRGHHHAGLQKPGQHAPAGSMSGMLSSLTLGGAMTPFPASTVPGTPTGAHAILIDDMIDTGHTVKLAAEVLKEAGAKDIYVLICHGLLSDVTMKTLRDLPIKKLIVTNSIDQTARVEATDGKMGTIDIAPLIAESIRRTHNGESISALFRADPLYV